MKTWPIVGILGEWCDFGVGSTWLPGQFLRSPGDP